MKKLILPFFLLVLFLILSACAEPLAEPPDTAAVATEPISTHDTDTPVDKVDALSAVITAIGPESTFYAVGTTAYYTPDDLLDQIMATGGLLHYGQTTLYSTSLLFEYLEDQQNALRERLPQIDASAFELIEQQTAQEKERSGSFVALMENIDGSTYRIEIYPCLKDGVITEAVIRAAVLNGDSAYYCGPWNETLFNGLTDMYMDCHSSDEPTDNTAYITLPNETAPRTLLRYLNTKLVNIVDGITLTEAPLDTDTSGCNIKILIESKEYLIDSENGIVLHEANAYQLKESTAILLSQLLKQAK